MQKQGGGGPLNSGNCLSPLFTGICAQVLSFQTPANSFASTKNSTLLFSGDSALFHKITGVGVGSLFLSVNSRYSVVSVLIPSFSFNLQLSAANLAPVPLPFPQRCILFIS